MKFTLKDYQGEAVHDVLSHLYKARKRWHEDNENHAFSLTAATGAGKTVMAAAVFEAIFHGDDTYNFDRDPGAIVIWFSDDPSLNEQTRFRLMESSDRLIHTDLIVIENTFNRERFEPGKVYFLNTQKLGKKSLLVRGFEGDDDGQFPSLRPDLRAYTIWDTIRNTIEDPKLTLYLVLDEAHRGMGALDVGAQSEKPTIIKRLINGERGVPPIPVVWGISATVERFNMAMEVSRGRTRLPDVKVDSARVQDSGLLKDTIVLDIPDEVGKFDTVLIRRATEKLEASSNEWASYATQQGNDKTVVPLMVLQVPNKPSHGDIGNALDTIFKEWSELPENCIAHVFGEHTSQTFGRHMVPYVSPEHVQDQSWIRVLIAKDAISTGWDCPRAEVMVSFRSAIDRTHITQLLGRMVRTPLARRIPGNDRLNSVDCLLPSFDKATATSVAHALTEGGNDTPPIRRVLVNPREMKPNPSVSEEVWKKFLSLPSQTRPQRGAKPAVRLTALAHELAADGLLANAGKLAHADLHKALDVIFHDRTKEFANKRSAVMTVEGITLTASLRDSQVNSSSFEELADTIVVDDAYRRAARIFSPDVARTYTEILARRKEGAEDDLESALVEAREDIAAIGLLDNIQDAFDSEAKRLTAVWLAEYSDPIKALTDERQEAYRQIIALSTEPQDIDLAKPSSWIEATEKIQKAGAPTTLPTYGNHLLCDEQGLFPADFNDWESAVFESESQRLGFKFWYRNPSRPSQDSLGIAYEDADETKIVRPDFVFFIELSDGTIAADIVDPHGTQYSDALPKLQGLARYANTHTQSYRRIEAVAKVGGKLRFLDLTRGDVQSAVAAAPNAESLYGGSFANDY